MQSQRLLHQERDGILLQRLEAQYPLYLACYIYKQGGFAGQQTNGLARVQNKVILYQGDHYYSDVL